MAARRIWIGWVAVNMNGDAITTNLRLVTRRDRPTVYDRSTDLIPGERYVRCALVEVGASLWHPATQRARRNIRARDGARTRRQRRS